MTIIFKHILEITDIQTINLSIGGEILSVDNQNGKLCLWAIHKSSETQPRIIEIIGTGNPMLDSDQTRKFIGTVLIHSFVWHVFELI